MNLKALISIVAFATLLASISAHPVCAINDPTEELRFPTVPQPALSFCNGFNNWPGSCCSADSELTEARDPLNSLVNSALYPACYAQLKSVYCSWCDPWAGHIYGSEETSTATPYPMLCNAYCTRMFDACADVPLNQAYARRIGGIPAGTGTFTLKSAFATSGDYCNVYSTNSTLYCLTDNPSEVKQPDVQMPATPYPVEPAFPKLNLNDPALLTDPNWRNHLVQVLPVPGSNYLAASLQHGIVVIFDNNYDVTTYKIFLDIRGRTSYSEPTENGLHGLAFHPDFANNGYIYVKWNDGPNELMISRFTADAARTSILPETEVNFFKFPKASLIHNGGSPIFGDDGYLYIPVGDGISFTENFVPYNTAPDLTMPNGKVLRLDVNNVPQGAAYGIPSDNPFINTPNARPEIFAYGLRNPWTLTFDNHTKLWFIGDVGQATWEEINVLYKGKNYGWHKKEAFNCYYPGDQDCDVGPNEELPIFAYPHEESLCTTKPCAFGTSVIVGGVYRGDRVPSIRGQLLFSDFEKTTTYAMQFNPANPKQNVVYRLDLQGQDFPINIAGYGHDHSGEMYILNWYQANIMRFKAETVKPPTTLPPVPFPTEPNADVPASTTPINEGNPTAPPQVDPTTPPQVDPTTPSTITAPTTQNNQVSLGTRDRFDPRILGLAAAAALFYFA